MNYAFPVLLAILSFSSLASAKEFLISAPVSTENEDGNRLAPQFGTNPSSPTVYEMIPATQEIASALSTKGCTAMAVEGSVLSRQIEIDHENRRDLGETVKILVREVKDCRMVLRPR